MATYTVKQTGSFSHTFTMTDADGNALDLTDYTVTSSARLKRNTATTQALTVVDDDLPSGVFSVTLTPTDTTGMEDSQWEFDAKAVSADTLTVYFTETHVLDVQENIT